MSWLLQMMLQCTRGHVYLKELVLSFSWYIPAELSQIEGTGQQRERSRSLQGDIIQRDSCGRADRGSGSSRGYSQKKQHKTALFISEKRQKTREKSPKSHEKRPFFSMKLRVYKPPTLLFLAIYRAKTGASGFYIYGGFFQRGNPQEF